MLTSALIKEACADLEKKYFDYFVHHFAEWMKWAKASQRVADREPVSVEEIPEAFRTECKLMQAIVEMQDLGKFDWNNPILVKLFGELAQGPFYTFYGDIITKIALRLAQVSGITTLIEIGAGKANLTGIMLKQMNAIPFSLPIVTTDSQPVILENTEKLKADFPEAHLTPLLWNVTDVPSEELQAAVKSPALLYERYTLNYANTSAFKNLARIADILVLGDWFNYTGELFAYDYVFQKIGAKPLFYKDIKPLLDEYFPNQHIFDQRAQDALKIPNITMLIAWK
ncbi:MAG: hypothetical protein WCQ99_16940 [Pseudomonadota bacterium]